ncbi:hypothetical protein KR009_009228 [Drosophila setifemur]|nr:hypothetical protein KR009_009228 [Drosophila setifemur]
MCKVQIGFLVIVLNIATGLGQNLPHIACPEIFRYLEYRGEYIGHLSVYLDPMVEENIVRVNLSQRGRRPPETPGALTLLDDENTIRYNLRNNERLSYRIDFPTPGVVPKLTMISVNGEVLCRSSEYGAPSIRLSLSRFLKVDGPLMPLQPQRPRPIPRPQPQPQQPQRPFINQPQQPQRPFINETRQPQWSQQIPAAEPEPEPQVFTPQPTRPTSPPTQRPRTTTSSGNIPQTIGQLNGICGREKSIQTPFIHNGDVVERGQLPWMVALLEHVGKEYNFLCGGTLISARTVISAAHCFRFGSRNLPSSRTTVSLGRNSLDFVSPGALKGVSLLLLHEQYDPQIYTDADLALLQLSEHVVFDAFIRPICLWNDNFLLDLPSGHKSYVAGWGEDEKGNRNSRLAKMTDVDIITQPECRGNLSEENARFVTSRTICASSSRSSGPCSGDSGGGLMLQEQDIWMMRGVVSAGQRLGNRCDLTQPVIYTDLARHIDWLRQHMWF